MFFCSISGVEQKNISKNVEWNLFIDFDLSWISQQWKYTKTYWSFIIRLTNLAASDLEQRRKEKN